MLSICISPLHYALFSNPALFLKIINHLSLSMTKTSNDGIFGGENTFHNSRSSTQAEKSHGHKIISVQISIDLITGLPANGQFLAGCSRGARHEKIHKKRIIATEDR
jgi:hypothetical protein